jgi:hypothetical protein
MSEKIRRAHEEIDGPAVASIIQDFWREFDGVYGPEVMTSDLCAVGPLQSMIGLAIKNGKLGRPRDAGAADELSRLRYPDTTGQ